MGAFAFFLWVILAVAVAALHLVITTTQVALLLAGYALIISLRWGVAAAKLLCSLRALGYDEVARRQRAHSAVAAARTFPEYERCVAAVRADYPPPAPPPPPPAEAQLLASLCEARAASPEALKRVVHRALQRNLWATSANAPLRMELCAALSALRAPGAPDEQNSALYFAGLLAATGRTALCLSGGGALALAHLGVCDVLMSAGALPTIIHGVSGGSIVAAIVCVARDEAVRVVLDQPQQYLLGTTPLRKVLQLPAGDKPVADVPPLLFPPLSSQLSNYLLGSAFQDEPALLSSPLFAAAIRAQLGVRFCAAPRRAPGVAS